MLAIVAIVALLAIVLASTILRPTDRNARKVSDYRSTN